MKIQFDPKQQYQLDAVAAVADLFEGQPLARPDYSVVFQTFDTELFSGQARTELGVGNGLVIIDEPQSVDSTGKSQEAIKVRCGRRHFESLGVPFAVVVDAAEV